MQKCKALRKVSNIHLLKYFPPLLLSLVGADELLAFWHYWGLEFSFGMVLSENNSAVVFLLLVDYKHILCLQLPSILFFSVVSSCPCLTSLQLVLQAKCFHWLHWGQRNFKVLPIYFQALQEICEDFRKVHLLMKIVSLWYFFSLKYTGYRCNSFHFDQIV